MIKDSERSDRREKNALAVPEADIRHEVPEILLLSLSTN